VRAPEITYRFQYPKDVSGPTFEIVNGTESGSASALTITLDVQNIPKDRILCLSNITMIANPNATNGVVNLVASIITGAQQRIQIINEEFPATADAEETMNWQGEVYILGGGRDTTALRFFFEFDDALAANTAVASWAGVIVPRGNASQF